MERCEYDSAQLEWHPHGCLVKIRFTKKDSALVLTASILLTTVAVVSRWLVGEATLVILSILSPIVVLIALLELYRRLSEEYLEYYQKAENQRDQLYRQIECLFSLFFTLKPTLPLPDTRGFAASPDLLKKIIEVILIEKPGVVVEASSGVSTVIIAYCLKQLGKGKVVSLEHDATYAVITQNLIFEHGLGDIATVVHAPLVETVISEQKWLWYNQDCWRIESPIDLVVVDGPPRNVQELARYPAVPLLYDLLSNRSCIIIDDGHRKDEKQIVSQWEKEYHLSSEFFNTEKGVYILRKKDCQESVLLRLRFGSPSEQPPPRPLTAWYTDR